MDVKWPAKTSEESHEGSSEADFQFLKNDFIFTSTSTQTTEALSERLGRPFDYERQPCTAIFLCGFDLVSSPLSIELLTLNKR